MDTRPITPRALRVPDFCATYGISRSTLYMLIKRGDVRMVKIAGRTVIPTEEGDALIRKPDPSASA
jgi:predicted DNA-binding transcriptional regulator AlpA